jgi:hypothetical protein
LSIKGQLGGGIIHLFRESGCQEGYKGRNDAGSGDNGGDYYDGGRGLSTMVGKMLAYACLAIEALSPRSRKRFITNFVKDHLGGDEEEVGRKGWGGGIEMPSFNEG